MDVRIPVEPELSESEFSCHCCYQVLVDPTTLTCGHSFCRHCLASWWASALPRIRTDCPECRALWVGFPKVNILLRDAVEKLFPADVSRRRKAVESDPGFCHVLQLFQQQENTQAPRAAPPQNPPQNNMAAFHTGVVTALTWVAIVVLLYHAFSTDSSHEVLLSKPLSRWSADDVTLWVEHLGVWTNHYKETFRREKINGRLLSALSDDDLSSPPLSIESQSHRQIILEELHRLQDTRVSLSLWQYKCTAPLQLVQRLGHTSFTQFCGPSFSSTQYSVFEDLFLGKTVFLLIALRNFPRLTLLYLFLLDYEDTFLPFIHSSCPVTPDDPSNTPLDWPSWRQWAEFLLMYLLLPHQLLSALAWRCMSSHYWTSAFVIVHAALLTLLDVCFYRTLWRRGQIRTLPQLVWFQVIAVVRDSSVFVLLWPLVPLCIIYFEIYIQLFFIPFLTAALALRTLLPADTQHRR